MNLSTADQRRLDVYVGLAMQQGFTWGLVIGALLGSGVGYVVMRFVMRCVTP